MRVDGENSLNSQVEGELFQQIDESMEDFVKEETDSQEPISIEIQNEIVGDDPEMHKLLDEQPEKRRRSIRTEHTVKKKPAKYDEIFNCYKRKEFREAIIYIDLVTESARIPEYQILKSACMIHLGYKINEAHKILDDVLKIQPKNAFSLYAKGLAYFHEEEWAKSITFFESAIAQDKSSMQRAEVMLALSKERLKKIESDPKLCNRVDEEDMDTDEEDNSAHRFFCDLCNKPFYKKYNLDRHNRSIHDRETPAAAPPKAVESSGSNVEEASEILDEIVDIEPESPERSKRKSKKTFKMKIATKTKIGSKTKKGRTGSLSRTHIKNNLVRCKVCKKMYQKSSIARHEIIHTGVKPHKCHICPKAFYQKSDLQRHVTVHTDDFHFECEICDKKFRIKKNLQLHNKRHHS